METGRDRALPSALHIVPPSTPPRPEKNMARASAALALLSPVLLWTAAWAQVPATSDAAAGFSLNPPYFNLADGASASATATCGQDERRGPRRDLYCKLVGGPAAGADSQTIQGQFCDHCNSNDPNKAHPVTNAIDGTERWWQSPPLSRGMQYNEVNVTLDLKQLFHVAYVLIKFANSPRPDLWILERSVDHGKTFTPWQYFAHSKRECIEQFGKQPNLRIVGDDEQICTTEYSRIVPLEDGEIVVSLVNGRPGSRNFSYSPELQEFTKATTIRLRFLRTSTLLGHLISKAQRDPTVTRRYFYSIKDISIGGRCVCHGHARECGSQYPGGRNRLQCDCQHNTCGESCDRCCPGYNQKPWRSATPHNANECQPCQCHSHATDCYYDPEVERRKASLNIYGRYDGGGVCISCQHYTAGVNCEVCATGYYRPYGVPRESPTGCISCRCDSRTTAGCEMGSGRCICKPEFSGEHCDHCATGYYGYPECIRYPVYQTTVKPTAGELTDCPLGYFGPPRCQCEFTPPSRNLFSSLLLKLLYPSAVRRGTCRCEGQGVADRVCGPRGVCQCLVNYAGQQCDQCATGYHGYPYCSPCQCSPDGSLGPACDIESGQCSCRPGFSGLFCDHCIRPDLNFPFCSESILPPSPQCNPGGSEVGIKIRPSAPCVCLPNVEGIRCDRCKPLYWNLSPENPEGCVACLCDNKGTLSGVGECHQESGECYCKPNTCTHSCNTCNEGFFQLQKKSYFGCQGCQCDVGGAMGNECNGATGQCQCRKNIRGRSCTEPDKNFYFPSLHHHIYEIENGITPNARPVRFGYDPQEFPQFSWRGYAIMSTAQPEVVLFLAVGSPGPNYIVVRYVTPVPRGAVRGKILLVNQSGFHSCCDFAKIFLLSIYNGVSVSVHVDEALQSQFRLLLRYINPSQAPVSGSITTSHPRGDGGTQDGKDVLFPPSRSPAFLTVPGDGFAQPFTLSPGRWNIHIRAVGVLLDYLVLLPCDYYEAPILQERVTEPCTYIPTANQEENCLLYKHVPMDRFPSALASQGLVYRPDGSMRQPQIHRPTADHPEMVSINGGQAQLQLTLHIPRPGMYTVVLEYGSEADALQTVSLLVRDQSTQQHHALANIFSCAYSFLCRSVAVDESNRVAKLHMSHKAELLLQSSGGSFLLYKVFAVPFEDFSMEYVNPKMLCVSVHSRFTEDSEACVQSSFLIPTTTVMLNPPHTPPQPSGPLTTAPRGEGTLLKSPQTEVSLSGRVPEPGRYVVVMHSRQPEHTEVPVEVQLDAGRTWTGFANATFCPAVSGCRNLMVTDRRISLDLTQREVTLSLRIPPKNTLILNHILLVPDHLYSPDLLKELPLDKSTDFIRQCGEEGFHINPRTSSPFCRDAARSLVAKYHNGALPCSCDKEGAISSSCEPLGGQCPCRPHIIGRQCTRCATGYYGFPYCRPCQCGRRLCDEVTGECICPPQTVRPACDVCESQTFSYHPLLGCEGCDCSPTGVKVSAGGHCDSVTGQCTCKPRIAGRQCDRCNAGFHRFPECLPCNCNAGGVLPEVCDPDSGQCLCKRNVVGERCDVCRKGSFTFDPNSATGCTECYCFGATDQCDTSNKRRGKFVDMRDWHLQKNDLEQVASVLNPASNTVVADVQELSHSVKVLHWVAPKSYLGDRISSYGGFLTYQIKSFGLPSEGMYPLDKQPDLLLSGQEMTLVHSDPQFPSPDRLYYGRVQLVEGNFRHSITNRPVTRPELLMVLARLQNLQIRGLYFTQSQRLSLGEVGLEEASQTGSGGSASTVEVCTCPANYRGDSCQRCSPGFYRERTSTLLGHCVPCVCSGLSNQCEESTGKCLNCQYNTAGDYCERCKEGYYGSAIQKTCRPCPCPLAMDSNNFAVGCIQRPEGFKCFCKNGYTGDQCETCAPGYYGSPHLQGGSCHPCNCNGNSAYCDSRTGVCKNSLEPKDTSTECYECDSCAYTLLNDLRRLDDELQEMNDQVAKVIADSTGDERFRRLEESITKTKMLVNAFTQALNLQKLKLNSLEGDNKVLQDDISNLTLQANNGARAVENTLGSIDLTTQRAKDLLYQSQNMLAKIYELLNKIKNASSSFTMVPTEDLDRLVKEAERLVNEMAERNFTKQKNAAETELEQAQKLLDHIKNNVTRQCEKNKQAASKITNILNDYMTKLKDLQGALKEAEATVKNANSQNSLNSQTLNELMKRIANLERERDKVAKEITMAKNQLKKAANLQKELENMKNDYEKLAAEMYGAKSSLTNKVNNISQAAAKEDIVRKAEKHAQMLSNLANELQEAVKNVSNLQLVRNATAVMYAYEDIINAINTAEKAAAEAKNASSKALEDVKGMNLSGRAKDLNAKSISLLNDTQVAQKGLEATAVQLADQKKRLDDSKKKSDELQRDLLAAQEALKNTTRGDIANMTDQAKKAAANANDTAKATMDALDAINKSLKTFGGPGSNGTLNGTIGNVENSVSNLSNTIDDLLSKVNSITPNITRTSNVSENIKRIKELIEEARDAANKIVVPMKFSGDSYVELRPPKDVDDLKAYTDITVALQRPQILPVRDGPGGDSNRRRRRQAPDGSDSQFVLYLGSSSGAGDYIGMAVINEDLYIYTVYKLSGQQHNITVPAISRSKPDPAMFDRVQLKRIYQDTMVIVTRMISTDKPRPPEVTSSEGDPSKPILNFDPKDLVFYVGGYPDSFTPPDLINYPKYTGCIELTSINQRFASLYNFKNYSNINKEPPCKRYYQKEKAEYFEGTGYAKVNVIQKDTTLKLEQQIRTPAQNAALIFLSDETSSYHSLNLENSTFVLRTRENGIEDVKKSSPIQRPVNSVFRIIENNGALTYLIDANQTFKVDIGSVKNLSQYYIGGVPTYLREKFNFWTQPLKGCVLGVKVRYTETPYAYKVGVGSGCPANMTINKAEFAYNSSLDGDSSGFGLAGDFSVTLGFRTNQTNGLLFQNSQQGTTVEVSILNGYVILRFQDRTQRSKNKYNDGNWHYVSVSRNAASLNLNVDGKDGGESQPSTTPAPPTSDRIFLGKGMFKGCISKLYLRRRVNDILQLEDFSSYNVLENIQLDTCSSHRSPENIMASRNATFIAKGLEDEVDDTTVSGCPAPPHDRLSYFFGGVTSGLSYSKTSKDIHNRPHFSLDVRTRSAEGLLFYAGADQENNHLALYLSKGRIRLSVGRRREIFNREKYNDGKWHTVVFSLEKRKFRLVVDGIRAQDGIFYPSEIASVHLTSPLYLGSAPAPIHQELKWKNLPKHNMIGCIRNFKMNGLTLADPTTNHGVGPCFDGQTDSGAYFSGKGGYAVIDKSFVVGLSFELVFEFRPRSLTGVLLHVGDQHHLSVYMRRGEVVSKVSSGEVAFSVSVWPKQPLCDGAFHRVAVIKRNNVVEMHVDTEGNYTIGPASSTTTLTKDPLYVGGIPDALQPTALPVRTSFTGCIQNMQVNGELVAFEKLQTVFGPVNLRECPAG
ncbi:laminin subunit alpha-3-like [Denticeps clupeoides]|uniref:laminin subunit alpha-3-like n=1 Tax=Denticeps clupeoides TaxID=299321 RepID=UPI0010A388A4|nr:laminin subunit alpha-3 [Denticeps clupeoides]